METKQEVSKASWGPGLWVDEPDHTKFAHRGLECVVRRHPTLGHLCGYVGVPEGHPLYKVGYLSRVEGLAEFCASRKEPIGECPPFGAMISAMCGDDPADSPEGAFAVHGGITYSSFGIANTDLDLWFFGFDCAHAGDYSPGINRNFGDSGDDTYRDHKYVDTETRRLADQIADFAAQIGGAA